MFLVCAITGLLICYLESLAAKLIISFFFLAKLLAYSRRSGVELHYSQENDLFKEFDEKSKIKKMKFEPYLWAPHALQQGFFYLMSEKLYRWLYLNKFNRECITLPDGGTIGLDWDGDIPNPADKPDKPYMLICPGLGGDSRNLYSLMLLWQAR